METMDTTMQVADIAKEVPVSLGLGNSEHGGKELGLASGLAFDTDMHDQHKILIEEGTPEVSQSRGDVIEGDASYLGGNEKKKNAEPQCSGDRTRLGSDTLVSILLRSSVPSVNLVNPACRFSRKLKVTNPLDPLLNFITKLS